jgi:hypothetical protein
MTDGREEEVGAVDVKVAGIVKAAKSAHDRHKASIEAARATAAAIQAATGYGRPAGPASTGGAS